MDEVTKFLINIQDRLGRIEGDIAGIKDDVKEHMRRTDQNEQWIRDNRKSILLAQGAIGLICVLSALVTIVARLGLIR